MPRVSKFDVKKGTTVELHVTDKVWKRICEVPSVFGANLKWALAPQILPEAVFDKGAPHKKYEGKALSAKPHDDLGESRKVGYTESNYSYDLDQGKKLFKNGEYTQALDFLERAIAFKPKNPYIKGLIKKIKNG